MSDTHAAVEAALTQAFQQTGVMVTKWVLAAEVVDEDGKRSIWSLAPEDQMPWDSLGLLAFVRQLRDAGSVVDRLLEEDL